MTDDPRIAHVLGLIRDVLVDRDAAAISHYFTPDAVMVINDKALEGRDAIRARVAWMADNTSPPRVEQGPLFFGPGDEGFEAHIAYVEHDGQAHAFKVFAYIRMEGDMISRYEDVTLELGADTVSPIINAA